MKFLYLLILTWVIADLSADVASIKGSIEFDSNSNGEQEAKLNSTGLGIGTTPNAKLDVSGNAIVSEKLMLGSNSESASTLHLSGTIQKAPYVLNSDTVLSSYSQVLADSSLSSNLFLYLPNASSTQGRIYNIKKSTQSNNVIITGNENIDSRDSYFLGNGKLGSLKVISNGLQWYILSAQNGESTQSPDIISVTANDPSDDDYILDDGDSLTLVFDQATNRPNVASTSQIDALIDFGDKSLGTNYSGVWSNSITLVITVLDSTGATLRIDDSLSIKASGNLMTAEVSTKASSATSTIIGDWGVFTPSSLSNMRLWLDGSDLDGDGSSEDLSESGLSGNLIDTWVDKSGGNTATAVTTERAVLIPSTLNGNAIIRFDGTDDHFDFNEVNNIRSVFMVVKEETPGNGFLLGHNSSFDFHRFTSSPYYMFHPTHASKVHNGNTYIDGVEVNPLTTVMPSTYRVISIVSSANVKSNTLVTDRHIVSRYWNGDIAEVILYSDPISDSDRITLESYLLQKWGLGGTVQIQSVIADDLDNGDTVLGSGDNITINFDLSTNQPDVSSKSDIDQLIDFEGYTFWSDYTGVWNSLSELVITANGVGSGNLPIGANISIKASGNLEDANGLFGVSTSSSNLTGNWGLSSSLLVSTVPLSFANLQLWLDADDLDGDGFRTGANELGLSNGNVIDTWVDKSGQGNDATAELDERPIYSPSTLNGNAIVLFDGADDHISFDEIDNIRTVFLVIKEDTIDNNFLLGHLSTYHFHRNGARIWHSTHTHANIKNGNTYVDGTLVDGRTTNLPTDYTMISVVTTGNVEAQNLSNDRNIGGRYWDGKVAEVILYSDALSDTDRQTIENYLRAKWGTP